jgi:ketosteroid isomerase-like protein
MPAACGTVSGVDQFPPVSNDRLSDSNPDVLRGQKAPEFLTSGINMRKIALAFVFALSVALPAGASDIAEVMSVARQWVDSFNRADVDSIIATCADQAAVIDDFPPHEWHGSGACKRWFGDFKSMSMAAGTTAHRIAIEAASHTEITDKFCYVVIPARLYFERKGKSVQDKGVLTMTLQNGTSGWRITGWVWSDQ